MRFLKLERKVYFAVFRLKSKTSKFSIKFYKLKSTTFSKRIVWSFTLVKKKTFHDSRFVKKDSQQWIFIIHFTYNFFRSKFSSNFAIISESFDVKKKIQHNYCEFLERKMFLALSSSVDNTFDKIWLWNKVFLYFFL